MYVYEALSPVLGAIYLLSAISAELLPIILTNKDLPRTLSSSRWIGCFFMDPPLRSEDAVLCGKGLGQVLGSVVGGVG